MPSFKNDLRRFQRFDAASDKIRFKKAPLRNNKACDSWTDSVPVVFCYRLFPRISPKICNADVGYQPKYAVI